jgi:hypothetical protein
MTRRRPTLLHLLGRAAPAFWLVAALFFQSMPSVQADMPGHSMARTAAVMPHLVAPPCHDGIDTSSEPQPEPQPQPSKSSMACCAAAFCGMIVQAMPPDLPVLDAVSATGFARPARFALHVGAKAPPLLRPPAILS